MSLRKVGSLPVDRKWLIPVGWQEPVLELWISEVQQPSSLVGCRALNVCSHSTSTRLPPVLPAKRVREGRESYCTLFVFIFFIIMMSRHFKDRIYFSFLIVVEEAHCLACELVLWTSHFLNVVQVLGGSAGIVSKGDVTWVCLFFTVFRFLLGFYLQQVLNYNTECRTAMADFSIEGLELLLALEVESRETLF